MKMTGSNQRGLVFFSGTGALVARHTAYMVVNVTTYEALKATFAEKKYRFERGCLLRQVYLQQLRHLIM